MKPAKIYSIEQNALGITIVHSAGTFFFKTNEILSIEYRNRFFSKIKNSEDTLFWPLTICIFCGGFALLLEQRGFGIELFGISILINCISSYLLVRTLYFYSRRDYFTKDIILITLMNNQSISLVDTAEFLPMLTLNYKGWSWPLKS
jgi:hypothetical protein